MNIIVECALVAGLILVGAAAGYLSGRDSAERRIQDLEARHAALRSSLSTIGARWVECRDGTLRGSQIVACGAEVLRILEDGE